MQILKRNESSNISYADLNKNTASSKNVEFYQKPASEYESARPISRQVPVKQSSKTSSNFYSNAPTMGFNSLQDLRCQTDAIRENTMQRIDAMGYKPPVAWKDELYRNEIIKLDIKEQLRKNTNSDYKSTLTLPSG